jgi:hypothetical protein
MENDDDNFDIILDSVPPGTLHAPQASPAPPAYEPPQPAAPLSEQPTYPPFQTLVPPQQAAPVFLPQTPAAPQAPMPVFTAPAPAAAVQTAPAPPNPTAPPKRSRRGVIVGIVLLLVAVNGVVVAHRYGLISFPDLTSGGGKKSDGPQARKSDGNSGQQANNTANPNGGNANPDSGNAEGGNPGVNPNGGKKPDGGNAGGPAPADGNAGAGKPKPPATQTAPQAKPRPFQGTRDVFAAVQDHLLKLPQEDRKFQRYFALAHLSNDRDLSDQQLEQYRAALTALVRHLQPSKESVNVEPIDKARVVLCLDLRTVGWDPHLTWREVLKNYPYLLSHGKAKDADVADLAKEVEELTGCDMAVVHLDWFLYAAGRSPLREKLGPDANPQLPPAVTGLEGRYLKGVTLEQAARELGLADPAPLQQAVRASERLRQRGLGVLLNGGTVSRQQWTSPAPLFTPYQEAGQELGLGTPSSY